MSKFKSTRYAYVFLVMKGDAYIAGALACAYSIKKSGSVYDCICMVTDDVSELGRKRLKYVFTDVVNVPTIQYPVLPMKTTKQQNMYASWIDMSFTKWNCLTLTSYEKVLFMDADMIVLSNIDHLFELSAPAGTFSSPWAHCYIQHRSSDSTKGGKSGPKYRGMFNPYEHVKHGEKVHKTMIHQGLYNHSFVTIGSMVLLSPSHQDYDDFLKFLDTCTQNKHNPFGLPTCYSGADEQSITLFYQAQQEETRKQIEWTHIHQKYNFIPWHRQWLLKHEKPYVFHFFHTKPWELDRQKWLDLESWWEIVTAMHNDDTYLTQNERDDLLLNVYNYNYKSITNQQKKQIGCCWCRFSELNNWNAHNVFDTKGKIECPYLSS